MNPWITGQLIEATQRAARDNARQARVGRHATLARHERRQEHAATSSEPRRARIGFAVARFGLRIAGRSGEQLARGRGLEHLGMGH